MIGRRAIILAPLIWAGVVAEGHAGMFGKSKAVALTWEWPADRAVADWIVVDLSEVSTPSKGFLGIGGSPSIADNLPDPIELRGTIVAGAATGSDVAITLPRPEAPFAQVGGRIVLGMLPGQIVINVLDLPFAMSPDEALAWARAL